MSYQISVNKKSCIGCGSCSSICPEIFEMKDGKAHVTKTTLEKIDCEKDAESSCPTESIKIKKV